MPPKALSFSPRKKRVPKSQLSTHPASVATRKWERSLSGLDRELHRIDKAAGVRKVRTKARLRKASGWGGLSTAQQSSRQNDAIADIEKWKGAQKERARAKWKIMTEGHGDDKIVGNCVETAEGDALDDPRENFDTGEVMRGSDSDEEESVSLEAEESDTVEGDDFGDEAKALILEDMEAIFKRQQKANVE